MELEKYWNEKYPQQKIIYSGRSIPKLCPTCKHPSLKSNLTLDVRNKIHADDVQLKELIQKHDLKGTTQDDTMMRIQKWVCANFKYIYDHDNQGAAEHWQFPFESLSSLLGDCEDGAILICSLGLNAGVEDFRLRVAAGNVQPEPTAPQGGHGWCTYVRESDDQAVPLDWCYFGDPEVKMADKKMLKNNNKYGAVWFSFNHLYSFGESAQEVPKRLKGE